VKAHRLQSLDHRFAGVVSALVEDAEDPVHEGRVKVRFPWLDDVTVTEWCRVSQLYAGNGYGALFVPEVGDEVLVAFVHGDPNEPVVLGGMYNGKDKPVAHKDRTQQDKKLIHTKGGHEVLLEDTAQAKKVKVTTAGGHEVLLDDAGRSVAVKSSGGQKIEIDASGKITCTGTSVTLDASEVKLGGAGASQPLVLGNLLLTLFNTHVHPVGPISSGPPATPLTPAVLSVTSKTV
jgi:uncharacterized protein involved in type VI secretion and phage assembly